MLLHTALHQSRTLPEQPAGALPTGSCPPAAHQPTVARGPAHAAFLRPINCITSAPCAAGLAWTYSGRRSGRYRPSRASWRSVINSTLEAALFPRIHPPASHSSQGERHGLMPCSLHGRAIGSSFPSTLPPKRGTPLGTEGVCVAFGRWLVVWLVLLGCFCFWLVVCLSACFAGLRILLKHSPTSLDWPVGLLPIFFAALERPPSSTTSA